MKMIFASLIIAFMFSVGAAQTLKRSDFLKPQPITSNTWKPYASPMSIASSAVCFSGVAADVVSSNGLQERNPLLRNSEGGVNRGRAIAFGAATCSVSFLFEKRHPKLASIIRFSLGGIHFGAAIHNWRVK